MVRTDYILRLQMMVDDLEEAEMLIHRQREICADMLENLRMDRGRAIIEDFIKREEEGVRDD